MGINIRQKTNFDLSETSESKDIGEGYQQVIPVGDENPQREGWYEKDPNNPDQYILTEDTVIAKSFYPSFLNDILSFIGKSKIYYIKKGEEFSYKSITFDGKEVYKFGYCINDNEGMNYPIFLVFSDDPNKDVPFYIGKTGMFEFQPEDWDDVNDPRPEDEKNDPAKVYITKVKIYEKVPFVIDYCYSV